MDSAEKLDALNKAKILLEKEIYTQCCFIGIEPESMDTNSFNHEEFISSVPLNPTNAEWIAYQSISRYMNRLIFINQELEKNQA